MDPDAQFQQNQEEFLQNDINLQESQIQQNEQNDLSIEIPNQNNQQNLIAPLIEQQQQQPEQKVISNGDALSLQMQVLQQQKQILALQVQSQMQINQKILDDQQIKINGQKNEVTTYTTLFSEGGENVKKLVTQVSKSMFQNCEFKVEGVKLRNNINLYKEKNADIIENKIFMKFKEANPEIDENKIKQSQIMQCVTPLFNSLLVKWGTVYCFSLIFFLFQWTYIIFVITQSKKFFIDSWLSWLGIIEVAFTTYNFVSVVISKRFLQNQPLRIARKTAWTNWILHFFAFYQMIAEQTYYYQGPLSVPFIIFFFIFMFFSIVLKGVYFLLVYELQQNFERIFVIVGEDPIDILES